MNIFITDFRTLRILEDDFYTITVESWEDDGKQFVYRNVKAKYLRKLGRKVLLAFAFFS